MSLENIIAMGYLEHLMSKGLSVEIKKDPEPIVTGDNYRLTLSREGVILQVICGETLRQAVSAAMAYTSLRELQEKEATE